MAGVVLVHGAWHGAWCWDGVVDELAAAGVPVTAVELPLTGVDKDVAATRRAILRCGDDVVVLGHSYGGLVVSEAASGMSEVSHLVYLAALMLDTGEDMVELMAEHESEMLGIGVPEGDGFVVERARAPELLYGDSDEAVVASVLPRLRPMHLHGELRVERLPAWRDTPSTYVVCSNDRAIPPALQRQMATRADTVVEWPTDHSPFLTKAGGHRGAGWRCRSAADDEAPRFGIVMSGGAEAQRSRYLIGMLLGPWTKLARIHMGSPASSRCSRRPRSSL